MSRSIIPSFVALVMMTPSLASAQRTDPGVDADLVRRIDDAMKRSPKMGSRVQGRIAETFFADRAEFRNLARVSLAPTSAQSKAARYFLASKQIGICEAGLLTLHRTTLFVVLMKAQSVIPDESLKTTLYKLMTLVHTQLGKVEQKKAALKAFEVALRSAAKKEGQVAERHTRLGLYQGFAVVIGGGYGTPEKSVNSWFSLELKPGPSQMVFNQIRSMMGGMAKGIEGMSNEQLKAITAFNKGPYEGKAVMKASEAVDAAYLKWIEG